MPAKPVRRGGLTHLDPAVVAWQQGAATNTAALTPKQHADRGRVRVRLDVPPTVATALAALAEALQTSQSQAGALLLAYALDLAGREPLAGLLQSQLRRAAAINVKNDLEIPPGILTGLAKSGANSGHISGANGKTPSGP
jgi:hypothetical protein